MTPSAPLEGDLKSAVLNALKPLEAARRCKVIRMQAGRARGGKIRLGEPGTPDLLVMLRGGESVWLELKRPGITTARAAQGKTRIAQAKWRADAEQLEHRVYVVTSVQDAINVVQLPGARDQSAVGHSASSRPEVRHG